MLLLPSRLYCFYIQLNLPLVVLPALLKYTTVSTEQFSIGQVYDDQINAVAICSILYTILSLGACVSIK